MNGIAIYHSEDIKQLLRERLPIEFIWNAHRLTAAPRWPRNEWQQDHQVESVWSQLRGNYKNGWTAIAVFTNLEDLTVTVPEQTKRLETVQN